MSIYIKNVPTAFMVLGDKEFLVNDIYLAVIEMESTIGNEGLRDYELESSYDCMENLVKLGYVSNYTGSRMANMYAIKDIEAIAAIRKEIEEYFENNHKDEEK